MSAQQRIVSVQALMDASGVRFGTSGMRGLVSALSQELCFACTLAFLPVAGTGVQRRVAIGIDLRPSSPDIAAACASAARYAGLEADFCGVLPTPALACYAQQQKIPAIMVTGSHIPFDRNGIKFYLPSGEITKKHEADITAATVALPNPLPMSELPPVNLGASLRYAARYLSFFPAGCLAGMRLGLYEHSSAARDGLRELLQSLGAEVISLGRTDAFVPIDTEAVSEADARQAEQWAAEVGFNALLSTDGDADRPLIADELGRWIRGDIVGLLCAQYLGARGVAVPVSCNSAIELTGSFSEVVRTRIGSPYVIEGMERLQLSVAQPVVGFEANGGFLLGSQISKDGRSLSPLPTRDAVLPMLALLAMARERGCRLSQLAGSLPSRFTASDRLQSFPIERSSWLIDDLAASRDAIIGLFGDLCGEPAGLDRTDGLRITFGSGEIVHLRPSGNVPELRCYAEADSQERAGSLAVQALYRIRERFLPAGA